MPVTGQELIAKNIKAFGGGFVNHVNKTMVQVQYTLEAKVIQNISLRDHSTSDLRKMDSPYATRHGGGADIHDPSYLVHKQGGALRSSERGGTISADISSGKLTATAYVGLDASVAPYAEFVVFGTSKMIPRPVLEGSKNEVLPECKRMIRSALKNLVTTFKGST